LTSLSLSYPLSIAFASSKPDAPEARRPFPITIKVLKTAYEEEKQAYENYVSYSGKAIEEEFPNIAYLFTAFAMSEKIHAENYDKILASMGARPEKREFEVVILDTKSNLINATEGELKKINKTYPDLLAQLKQEAYEQAIINCMYSWKSHQQHKRKIDEIRKYSKYFFSHVVKRIEGLKLDFHVCEICGSTIDEAPRSPCDICKGPHSHYHKINRPT
jgi:rubrerythrin